MSLVLLGVILWIRISFIFAENPSSAEYLKFATASFLFFSFAFITSKEDSKRVLHFILIFLAILGSLEALWAIAQYLVQSDLGLKVLAEKQFGLKIPGTATVKSYLGHMVVRSHGNFDHPNALGGFLAAAILASCTLFLQVKSRLQKGLLVVAYCLEAVALITTYSRSAWLGAAVAMTIWTLQNLFYYRDSAMAKWLRLRGLFAVHILVLLVCSFCFREEIFHRLKQGERQKDVVPSGQITQYVALNGSRLDFQKIAKRMIGQHPLAGVGFGGFVRQMEEYKGEGVGTSERLPVHNIYYLLAAETGLPSLLLLIVFLAMLLKAIRDKPLSPFIAVLAAFLVIGLVDNYFLTMQAGRLLFFVVCGGIVLQNYALSSRREIALA